MVLIILYLQGSGKTLAFGLPVIHHILSKQAIPTTSTEPTAPPTKRIKLASRSHETRKRKFERRLATIKRKRSSKKQLGCVHFEDDIPEEAFQTMLQQTGDIPAMEAGEIVDLEDVMLQREKGEGLGALIITPTRELALQVKSHISAVCKYTKVKVQCDNPTTVSMYY